MVKSKAIKFKCILPIKQLNGLITLSYVKPYLSTIKLYTNYYPSKARVVQQRGIEIILGENEVWAYLLKNDMIILKNDTKQK